MKKTELIAVDLFAGAGGFSLAAILAGFSIDFSIENDKFAVQTYKSNILRMKGGEDTLVFDRSILECCPKTIKEQRFKSKSCDLLLGGPPCQGFSAHRILDAGVGDPRNELILAYFDFVRELQPRVFLMENVPGILWERHEPYIKKFYSEAKKAGYHLYDPALLDARDFGLPQRRKRVFILGVKSSEYEPDFVWPPESTHCDPKKPVKGKSLWKTCAEVFRPTNQKDINDIHMNHGEELIEAFKRTPPNGGSRKDSGRILSCHKNHDGHKDVYGRIDPSQPAPTMTTACINPSKGRFVHPTEHHGITLRHAARIQTFPDNFTFWGGLTAAGRQIGNAVPVELGKHLIQHIKNNLLTPTSLNEANRVCEYSYKNKIEAL
ncbi:DNA (cytosine-5-)-methyltransferase [Pseudidiomarina aquimaris]|uniref:Cytosine-specific methyltransferase n=1 Tax=Pseudidiomarina aquimaris TaxID=641841 RepID=A0A432XHS2_9GAMM|nr:DNA cytosine methyltransferase [Pseudidiomarina aquimaris]RUO48265.1 DNA (cytosine-5-)-methyltransferase [Pseudidiomarina aquimaris]